MPLTRIKHWQTRAYHSFLIERANQPFKWGTNDCAMFCADGIKAQTGVDIASDFRNKYTDETGALATIKAVCNGSTVADAAAYCANKAGMQQLPHPLTAQRGDLVIVEDSGNLVAGLVHLSGRDIVVVSAQGLHRLPISKVKQAWRVSPNV